MLALGEVAELTPAEIYGFVAPELARVEEELRRYTRSPVRTISEIGEYLLDGGGKRIRPALLLLTAKMLGPVTDSVIRLAAVVEFIHNATLVHDDIIDDADTRRGRPTAGAEWGNPKTVLVGDWLYMQSFSVALGERNFDVLHTLIGITQRMVEGELLQMSLLGRSDVSEAQLLEIVESKTACLFSGCTRLPGITGGANHGMTERLSGVGRNLGMAFQLVDDLLDLTSTRDTLGKPVASDLKEGKVTLPVFYAIAGGGPGAASKISAVLREREFLTVTRDEILDLVEESGGLGRTRAQAAEFANQARRLLEPFAASMYRDALFSIADFILDRKA